MEMIVDATVGKSDRIDLFASYYRTPSAQITEMSIDTHPIDTDSAFPSPPPSSWIPPPPDVTISPPPSFEPTSLQSLISFFSGVIQRLEPTFLLREIPWLRRVLPRLLHPEFTWQHFVLGERTLSTQIPSYNRPIGPFTRRLIGYLHYGLREFSQYYCAWYGIRHRWVLAPLPFGLVLKWSDGTSLDEVSSMCAIRRAGIPAPLVISYGEHASTPWAPISILMTRIPGPELADVYKFLDPDKRQQIVSEIHAMLKTIRSWPNPWEKRIYSLSGGPIRSIRVPNHSLGPFESESELNDYLISTASLHGFKSTEDFENALAVAKKMQALSHPIVFTHGDFALHNILVYDGHVSGFIDWETAGWYPDYWEFTTPLRWTATNHEWGSLLLELGGSRYKAELECELAIRALTVDSWIF
ncbi:kinase-like domain-containing protein [Hypoxylon trugodes]|uniref:kinase-like domain-containing protein n=1 Tax=Hypoxylon trugodes TaxID=326681 RepID=UPI00218FF4B5|nr:kinase-like domain-containing protein [Hypoxylon trugodes]KAI1383784.1 kinase-like domain-containing protein [Hypoxylon trugodes]